MQVVDSPFAKLTELMMELVEEQKIPIPRSLMRVALSMMRRSVKKRAGFSIDEVAPIEQVQKAFIPCLFGKAPKQLLIHMLAGIQHCTNSRCNEHRRMLLLLLCHDTPCMWYLGISGWHWCVYWLLRSFGHNLWAASTSSGLV